MLNPGKKGGMEDTERGEGLKGVRALFLLSLEEISGYKIGRDEKYIRREK